MIENALLQPILDIISKKLRQPWQVPQDDNKFDPLHGLQINRNQEMGECTKKNQVDHTDEWATKRWENKKIKVQCPFIAKRRPRQNPQ
jgi:hypothetical protein